MKESAADHLLLFHLSLLSFFLSFFLPFLFCFSLFLLSFFLSKEEGSDHFMRQVRLNLLFASWIICLLASLASAATCGPSSCYRGGCTGQLPKQDVIFLFDVSLSMAPKINAMVSGLEHFALELDNSTDSSTQPSTLANPPLIFGKFATSHHYSSSSWSEFTNLSFFFFFSFHNLFFFIFFLFSKVHLGQAQGRFEWAGHDWRA